MAHTPATDTLSLVVEAIALAFQASRASKANLDYAALNGTLEVEVVFVPEHESYCGWNEASVYAEAIDASYLPAGGHRCWDHCNGITTVHRGTYCPFKAEHADLDCGCGEADYDYEDDEPLFEAVALVSYDAATDRLEVVEDEPF